MALRRVPNTPQGFELVRTEIMGTIGEMPGYPLDVTRDIALVTFVGVMAGIVGHLEMIAMCSAEMTAFPERWNETIAQFEAAMRLTQKNKG